MNRIHRLWGVTAVLALSAWACGVEEEPGGARGTEVEGPGDEAAPLRAVNTELALLAEASPSPEHWIGIYEMPDGGLGVFETGNEGEPSLLEGWNHEGSLVDYLRASVPNAVIGEAADAAERAGLSRAPLTPGFDAASLDRLEDLRGRAALEAAPVLTTRNGPIDPTLDAIRWMGDVCFAREDFWGNALSWFDDIDCRPNVGNTIIVSDPTVDYEAKVMNAGTNLGNSTVVLQELRGAEVINLGTWELRGRKWGTAMFRANAQYQIAVFGQLNHMSVRTRVPMPDAWEIEDYPFDNGDMAFEIHEDMQGVAHDASHWYFTNEKRIVRWDVGNDLRNAPDIAKYMDGVLAGEGFNHFGDLVYAKNHLYIPIESKAEVNLRGIAVYDTNLNYIDRALVDQPNAAWLAYNPLDGLFYTATTFEKVTSLRKYDIQLVNDIVTVTEVGNIPLQMSLAFLPRLQGGEFSDKGNLYVAADSDTNGGLYMIDVLTGFVAKQADLHFQDWGQELEGLTVWNLDNGAAPHVGGQIHVLMVENDWEDFSDDDLYFKHMRVNPLSSL